MALHHSLFTTRSSLLATHYSILAPRAQLADSQILMHLTWARAAIHPARQRNWRLCCASLCGPLSYKRGCMRRANAPAACCKTQASGSNQRSRGTRASGRNRSADWLGPELARLVAVGGDESVAERQARKWRSRLIKSRVAACCRAKKSQLSRACSLLIGARPCGGGGGGGGVTRRTRVSCRSSATRLLG